VMIFYETWGVGGFVCGTHTEQERMRGNMSCPQVNQVGAKHFFGQTLGVFLLI
jgi:hypothetical protein